MAAVFLSLGSNLGDREANIRKALDLIAIIPDTHIIRVSSLYETEPVGFTDQPDFINAAVLIETGLSPDDLLHALLNAEKEMGRVRNLRWGPRVIDIDILMHDALTISSDDITLPHPRMMERAFVMAPLAEIAPDLVLPDGRTPCEVLKTLENE